MNIIIASPTTNARIQVNQFTAPDGTPGNISLTDPSINPSIIRYVGLGRHFIQYSNNFVVKSTPIITPIANGKRNSTSNVLMAFNVSPYIPRARSKNDVEIPGNIKATAIIIPAIIIIMSMY